MDICPFDPPSKCSINLSYFFLNNAKIIRCFEKVQHYVWGLMETGEASGIKPSEETITDNILLIIYKTLGKSVRIDKFSKKEERKNGSDWLFYFYNKKKEPYFVFSVQAKRLSPRSNKYEHLHYSYEEGIYKKFQSNILKDFCDDEGINGIYFLYNYITNPTEIISNWRWGKPSDKMGITAIKVEDVITLRPQKGFIEINQHSFSPKCLFCPMAFRELHSSNTSVEELVKKFKFEAKVMQKGEYNSTTETLLNNLRYLLNGEVSPQDFNFYQIFDGAIGFEIEPTMEQQ